MKQQLFEQTHQATWQALEQHLSASANTPATAKDADFPQRYRQVCHHLALARDRHYTPYLVQRLNRLVLRGHQRLYGAGHTNLLGRIARFLGGDFPRAVRAEWRLFTLAALLFFGPLLGMATSVIYQPDLVYTLLDAEQVSSMESMYEPGAEHLGENRAADSDFLMFGFYIYNNTGIGFQTFASGLLFGLGSIFYLVLNGLFIGAVSGHLIVAGAQEPFFSFVSGHSAFELTAIVLAGTAGLKLGLALLAPGRYRRLDALHRAAGASISLVYGFAGLFLLAAFVEAFWSSNGAIEPLIKYSVGIALIVLLAIYFLFAGRRGDAA